MTQGHIVGLVEIRDGRGRVLKRLDGRTVVRRPSVVAMRPVLHGALLAAVQQDSLALASEAASFESLGASVTVYLRDGRSETGDLLIGADGVGSVIRKQLHPDEPLPRRSGYSAVRGALENVDKILRELSGVLYLAPRIEAAVVRAGPQSAYWYLSLPAEDVGERRDPRDILTVFAPRLDTTFQRVAEATEAANLRFDELYDRDPLRAWGAGRVTLLGDAAHPMLPHTGQGAAQALEDAVALGLALGSSNNLERNLRRYEQVRAAHTAPMVKLGRRIARVSTSRSAILSTMRNTALLLAPTKLVAAALQQSSHRDPHEQLR